MQQSAIDDTNPLKGEDNCTTPLHGIANVKHYRVLASVDDLSFCVFSCSGEFSSVAEMALRAVVDTVVVDMGAQSGGDLASGMPLARVLARVSQMGPTLLGESSKFIQIILNVPEVELFFTLIYSNMQNLID